MKQIIGGFSNPDGTSVANGRMFLNISQDAAAIGGPQISGSIPIVFQLDANGQLPPNALLWYNDELIPAGTAYQVSVLAAGGGLVYGPEFFIFAGASPSNIDSMFPSTIGGSVPVFSTAILSNPAVPQIITGQSLTLTPTAELFAANFENIRFADQFNGSDMGAKINAAIADLPSGGGVVDATAFQGTQSATVTIDINKSCLVKIGAVTLQLSGSPGINLSHTGAALIGLGSGASILQVNAGTNDAIQSNAINVMAKGFTINSAVARTSGAGIRCKGGNGAYEDFTIDKTFNGIQVTDSLSGASGNNHFNRIVMGSLVSPAGTWNAGIILGGVASGTVTGEFFENVDIIGTSVFADAMVILDSGCDTNHFTDCQFVQSGSDSFCVSVRNTNTSNAPQWNKFLNCVFEAGPTKTAVTHSAGILNNFINCTLATCGVFFQFNGGTSIHVVESKMVGCQQQAINITAGNDIKLVDNRISDSSLQTNGGFNAIQISANVNDFTIINNDFTTILSSANQPFNNISIPAGTSDRYWIYGNTFANSTGAGLNDAGTGVNKFTGLNSPNVLFTSYGGQAVAGQGVAVIRAVTSQKSESAADTNVLTFTPPATTGSYRVRFALSVSAAAAAILGWTLTYTDSNGNAQTPTNVALTQLGTAAPALTFTTSVAGNYYGYTDIDINNAAANIVVKFTLTGGTITAKASATIERIV